jgi:hypothetical protein
MTFSALTTVANFVKNSPLLIGVVGVAELCGYDK